MSIRPVRKILESQPTMEGAGVKLRRAFGFGDTVETDPFLLFDDFRNERPAVIHWTSPAPSVPRLPRLSPCATSPESTYVIVSMPRCGCHGKPAR